MEQKWGSEKTDFDDNMEFDGDIPGEEKSSNAGLIIGAIAVVALILAILGLVL